MFDFFKAVSWSGCYTDQLSWSQVHSVSLKGVCGSSDTSGMGQTPGQSACRLWYEVWGIKALSVWEMKMVKARVQIFFLSPLLETIYPLKLQWTESVWIIKRIMTQTTSSLYSCTYNHVLHDSCTSEAKPGFSGSSKCWLWWSNWSRIPGYWNMYLRHSFQSRRVVGRFLLLLLLDTVLLPNCMP